MTARTLKLYDAAIGKKAVMALSGLAMLGFVFGHMGWKLTDFQGPRGHERLR